jgi:hypothetical protein
MISHYKDYQLSLEELENFITLTKESGYYIEELHMHGIGEPLLWKHFDVGIARLKKSGVIDRISLISNGLLLDKIRDETWEYIDSLLVSIYPDFPKREELVKLKELHGDKIILMNSSEFSLKPARRYKGKIPCDCKCSGPMFVKDKIFLHCGPPAFDAAAVKGVDMFSLSGQSVKIKKITWMAMTKK